MFYCFQFEQRTCIMHFCNDCIWSVLIFTISFIFIFVFVDSVSFRCWFDRFSILSEFSPSIFLCLLLCFACWILCLLSVYVGQWVMLVPKIVFFSPYITIDFVLQKQIKSFLISFQNWWHEIDCHIFIL